MVCLRNVCINTLHKGDNDGDDDDDDNNNNNNRGIIEQAALIYLCNMKRFAVFRLSKRCSCGRDNALRHWVSV